MYLRSLATPFSCQVTFLTVYQHEYPHKHKHVDNEENSMFKKKVIGVTKNYKTEFPPLYPGATYDILVKEKGHLNVYKVILIDVLPNAVLVRNEEYKHFKLHKKSFIKQLKQFNNEV